ncbi:hypothetical protein [Dactylosporangium sp. CS-033363]
MVLSVVAGLVLVPCIWLLGSLAGVAVRALAGEARIHREVRRLTRSWT